MKKSAKKELEPAVASIRLQARVARMCDLEKQIEGLEKILKWPHNEDSQRVGPLRDRLAIASSEMEKARYKHTAAKSEFEKRLEVRGRGDDVDKAKADCETAKREFFQAERAFLYLKEKHDSLRAELDSATQELEELKKDCGFPDVLDFQQVLAATEQRVAELKARVTEQERVIEDAKASVPSADELLKRREDILAGLLTGDANEANLKAVNEERQALNQKIEAAAVRRAEVLDQAEPALAGLRRILEETEQELQDLNHQKPGMAAIPESAGLGGLRGLCEAGRGAGRKVCEANVIERFDLLDSRAAAH